MFPRNSDFPGQGYLFFLPGNREIHPGLTSLQGSDS